MPWIKRLKPYLRWVILGAMVMFLAAALRRHWQDVAVIRVDGAGWACVAIALGITLVAHVWSGWVWSWILCDLNQPVPGSWGVAVYLKTNIAKYLPGNVWHFYGRVWSTHAIGIPLATATLSVLLEPLLMAAAALAIALLSQRQANWLWQLGSLVLILAIVHPRLLNPPLQYLQRTKGRLTAPSQSRDRPLSIDPSHQDLSGADPAEPVLAPPALTDPTVDRPATDPSAVPLQLHRYPLRPFLGELGFVLLRSVGFLLTVQALQPLAIAQLPLLISAFGFAWLLGLIIPGAPGGLGVFEVTAIAILQQGGSSINTGVLLSAVALYRLVSIGAEAGGAALVWLAEKWSPDIPSKKT